MPTTAQEIAVLRRERKAVILAHNYVSGDIQDIADFTGDSLELSVMQRAAAHLQSATDLEEAVRAGEKAVEAMYNVTVTSVNTMVVCPKTKTRYTKSGVVEGRAAAYKKAIVTLKKGEQIDFYSNI